ncbi:DEAD/DEAH box helicase family protein [Saccharopolyspora sp. TS4A08]|uniref:DEAD/DEAH box helicase family protein n=1 Tax=Saccharopolyspora ipomoeae TaxID=3042027 RepID=A0ABT6PNT9_9PSEU|nr:DEAD/DEAH box helicase family protein [Saccharopolyspora sp. TS4A08]MDI2029505.1 DEAD/DEAH box helicase family protein [Saccharopolyspora sp. TS4A08]
MEPIGRDRRRGATRQQRALLYQAARGRCQRCGVELDADYQCAHLAAHRNGGGTTFANMEAWCSRCNLALGGKDAHPLPGVSLRDWQAEALPVIGDRLFQEGMATLHGAPGAGKTTFAALMFRKLRDAGYVGRMTVVVPNRALVGQWQSQLAEHGIHLDPSPVVGAVEGTGQAGLITTYHSLPNSAGTHLIRQQQQATFVVFDEVHHLASYAAWGLAAQRMIGGPDQLRARAVLNMTGTLFRSDPRHRIPTVPYRRVFVDRVPKLQAVADFSVSTQQLIKTVLRAPDLYRYAARAECVDLTGDAVPQHRLIADLDDQERSGVMLKILSSPEWIENFAREALALHDQQLDALGHAEPLKLLYVAPSIPAARLAQDKLNRLTGTDFARLVVSDETGAISTLRLAAAEPRPCAIVTVRMVTEGFDCPQVATIAYGTNIVAPLFIAQMMARAMRRTETEHSAGTPLPAKILIPDHPQIEASFVAAVRDAAPLAEETDDDERVGGLVGDRVERFELLGVEAPELSGVNVLDQEDGEVGAEDVREGVRFCESVDVPVTYAPRVAVGLRRRE